MLILCFGMPRSGSTLAFELVKGMLIGAGHAQDHLPEGVVEPGHTTNFIHLVTPALVDRLLAATPLERKLAFKTHSRIDSCIFTKLGQLQADGQLRIVASYRDPRDVCLSLIDAGARARRLGRKPFREFTDIASTIGPMLRNIEKFRRWGAIPGTLRLDYGTVAFSPDLAIGTLETTIGITCDRAAAKKHAYEEAFTQKHMGVKDRYRTEMTPEQQAELTTIFREFIEVCGSNDEQWFTSFRERFLVEPAPKPRTKRAR